MIRWWDSGSTACYETMDWGYQFGTSALRTSSGTLHQYASNVHALLLGLYAMLQEYAARIIIAFSYTDI